MFPIKLMSQPSDIEIFFNAVSVDNKNLIQQILERDFDPNMTTPEGESGLMLSLRTSSMSAFQILIQHPKININQRNRARESALMLAAFSGNREAVQLLLAREAEVNNAGWTALHYAASQGEVEILRWLLERHAYVDALAPNGITPLMMAARGGHVQAVKTLLEYGAIDSLKNDAGLTAEDFARRNGHEALALGFERRRQRSLSPAWLR